jgi:hypothetical protein
MSTNLEVSFNSPQCGWMSIGFDDGTSSFHTTTAHAPYRGALGDLMTILTEMQSGEGDYERTLKWNRDPEEFDFYFLRNGEKLTFEIYQYPGDDRDAAERQLVFSHVGTVGGTIMAFAKTFEQLFVDRETDEFEFNWRQPFPYREYEEFRKGTN